MEKKTIGKFISALRKANGMTQKELGEKLFVSDKTVSRWECDECTPELSLIPSIAEIFGITTDELLRGERNNPDREAATEDVASKQKAKSDKQFKLMLDRNSRKYKNLTLISIGITILGFIAAMIANLGFSKGLIALRHSTAVKIFLPCLFSLFIGGSCLVLRVELSVEHGIQLLLQALPDFFIEIVLAVQMVKHQIDEQLIGYLHVFHSLRFLSLPQR